MGTESGSDPESSSNGWSRARGLVVKTLVLIGGALLIKRLTKSTTRRDHARVVSRSLTGEKAFWRTPQKPFRQVCNHSFPDYLLIDSIREVYYCVAEVLCIVCLFWLQRLYMVKPCPKELKCDVEVSSYAIRDAEEYKNFCDRPKDQRPLPEEVIGNGASYCTSDLAVLKNSEIHLWDRGFDENRNQVHPIFVALIGLFQDVTTNNKKAHMKWVLVLGHGRFGDQRKDRTSSSQRHHQASTKTCLH
uniref:Uncharacterized protein n=1 Tax=Arabidopsis halleri TaxID=81970 RepID=K4FQP9_ARAHA|nr:hypothetical protein 11M19.7 [Arabidopsis halleri]